MDLYKYYTTSDSSTGKELVINKNMQNLEHILKKLLDLENSPISYNDIDNIVAKFGNISHFEYRSPVYFTLGYLATIQDWNTVWRLEEWLSKWLGIALVSFHTVRYYRFLSVQK